MSPDGSWLDTGPLRMLQAHCPSKRLQGLSRQQSVLEDFETCPPWREEEGCHNLPRARVTLRFTVRPYITPTLVAQNAPRQR